MRKITEESSAYNELECMSTRELVMNINREDHSVAPAVSRSAEQIIALVDAAFECMQSGGRLFYIGSGTSGRLGILDASECPPTFGVSHEKVYGIIAGGDVAIRKAVEHSEDDMEAGYMQLKDLNVSSGDFVVGLSASGYTPYVIGAMQQCASEGIKTACITCNPGTPLAAEVMFPVEVIVGPEFITGSTRMKSGTATKMVLNIISTSLMIKLGHVKGNKMVDMRPVNNKLLDRGARMIAEQTGVSYEKAYSLLEKTGSVRKVLEYLNQKG